MTWVYEKAVKEKGMDIKKVEALAKKLSKVCREADKMGLRVFGGTGSGTLRTSDDTIIADIDGTFDGGDGGTMQDEKGIYRGEAWFEDRKRER